MANSSSTIAAYDFTRRKWLYWDSETESYSLLETEPGKLMRIKETPIKIRHRLTV